MSDKGKSIMEAIRYLDAFYKDVGLMFGNFENLLAEKGFVSHPSTGNRATYSYGVTNHLGRSKTWTLKNIQRLYLKEEEIESISKSINKAILCSLALYSSSAFEIPVLICGVLKWEGNHDLDGIYSNWPTNEICNVIKPKNNWRIKDKAEAGEKKIIYRFRPLDKLKNIDEYSLFIVDLVKVESSKVLQEMVDAMVDLYDESEEIAINPDLLVDSIPEKLIETWTKPIVVKEEE